MYTTYIIDVLYSIYYFINGTLGIRCFYLTLYYKPSKIEGVRTFVKFRNRMCKIKKNYTKIPNILYSIKIPIGCKFLYTYCLSLPEDFNPSVSHLSKILGLSRRTINRYFNILVNFNILGKISSGYLITVSRYEFKPVSEWRVDNEKN